MKKYLIKLADHLDKKGLRKEANYVDWIMKNAAKYEGSFKKRKDVFRDGKGGKEKRDRRMEMYVKQRMIGIMNRYFSDKEVPKNKVLMDMPPRHFFIGIEMGWFSDNNISKEELKPFVKTKLVELTQDSPIFFRIYRSIMKNSEPFENLITLDDMREMSGMMIYDFGTHELYQKNFIALFNEGFFSAKDVEKYIRLVDISIYEPIGELLKLDVRLRFPDFSDDDLSDDEL